MAVRQAILDHMVRTAHLLLFQHIRSSHTLSLQQPLLLPVYSLLQEQDELRATL